MRIKVTIKNVSEWLLFNIKWTMCLPYHGYNRLVLIRWCRMMVVFY